MRGNLTGAGDVEGDLLVAEGSGIDEVGHIFRENFGWRSGSIQAVENEVEDQQPLPAHPRGGGQLELTLDLKGFGRNVAENGGVGLSLGINVGPGKSVKSLEWSEMM